MNIFRRSPAVTLPWLSLRGRCLPAELPDVRLGCPVTSAAPAAAGQRARVCWGAAQSQEFDAVIFATHSDTILSVLGKDAPQVPPCSLSQLLSWHQCSVSPMPSSPQYTCSDPAHL